MNTKEQIATFIFTEAIKETDYWIGKVDIENVETYFEIHISFTDFEEITDKIFELYGHLLADINNNENDYAFEEGEWSLNFLGKICFNEQEEPVTQEGLNAEQEDE